MDANLIVGGTPAPSFPNHDGTRRFVAPFSKRIAYEYRSGSYKLGHPVNFYLNNYQAAEVQAADTKVGEYLMMHVVPEEHVLSSVLLKVTTADKKAAGCQLTPVMLLVAKDGTISETSLLKDAAVMAMDTLSVQWVELEKRTFVAPGTSLIFAYKVTALPTDVKVKLADIQSVFSACLEVGGFDIPEQV